MLLVADIGNTNIVLGGIEQDTTVFEARIATVRGKTSDEYGAELLKILSFHGISPGEISDCIISSVVPPVLNSIRSGVMKVCGRKPFIVGPGMKTGLNIRTENPAQVGSDRIVAAVGALSCYPAPLIILDFGTATTMEVITRDKVYVGGCIIPGVQTAMNALISKTAQLPAVSLEKPARVTGSSTVECMQSGIMYGTASMVDGMLERLEEELGESATVIATGGIAPLIAPLCRRKIHLESNLILRGLNIIYKKNVRRSRRTEHQQE